MGRRLHEPFRHSLRRLRDTKTHAKVERRFLSRGHRAQRDCLTRLLSGLISAALRGSLRPLRSKSPLNAGNAEIHGGTQRKKADRSEEHTSELQSLAYLVCR